MYATLMLRGLLRHKKSGRRLFLLLALSSLAIMFTVAFRDSFARQYRQLGIDAVTAHLQVVPADSPKNRSDSYSDHRQGLVFMAYDAAFRSFLEGLEPVEVAMPVIETGGTLFNLDGEHTGYSFQLVGVEPKDFKRALPAARLSEGKDDLAWAGPGNEVPIFRPVPDAAMGEDPGHNDRFERGDFRPLDADWESYKVYVSGHFPRLFDEGAEFAGPSGDAAFLAAMNRALERSDLLEAAAPAPDSPYDWRLDDAMVALEAAEGMSADSERIKHRQRVVRKKYLQALMPKAIRPNWDIVTLDTAYTMAVPPARGDELLAMPAVLPVRIVGFVERMPLYFFNFYVDNAVLREYLGLGEADCSSLLIRLKPGADAAAVQAAIAAWIEERGLDYRVKDAESLGQLFLSTAVAFELITLIIVLLFVATVVIFVANAVKLALIKRRREMGTAIALGLSPSQNGVLLLGEMMALVLVAWTFGALLGLGLEAWLALAGLPGMIFFPGGVLHFVFSPLHALQSLAIMAPVALVSTAFALRKVGRQRAVDLLRD